MVILWMVAWRLLSMVVCHGFPNYEEFDDVFVAINRSHDPVGLVQRPTVIFKKNANRPNKLDSNGASFPYFFFKIAKLNKRPSNHHPF
jgi:hypothetical protein